MFTHAAQNQLWLAFLLATIFQFLIYTTELHYYEKFQNSVAMELMMEKRC